jgi:hypothetical protein
LRATYGRWLFPDGFRPVQIRPLQLNGCVPAVEERVMSKGMERKKETKKKPAKTKDEKRAEKRAKKA